MRRIVAHYLIVRFAGMFVFVVFALTSLLVLFDLLAHTDDLAVHHQQAVFPMAYYAALRLPVLLTMITPMSVLLAGLITFERMATQYETVALQSAGISLYQMCAVLLLGGAGIAALHFGIAESAATPAAARMFRWAEKNYEGLPGRTVLEPGPAWYAAGNYKVHVGNALGNGRVLDNVAAVEEDHPGSILAYYEARTAQFDGRTWTLRDGWRQSTAGGPRESFEARTLDIPLDPDHVAYVRIPVSHLDLATLRKLGDKPASHLPFPTSHYRIWMQRRWAEPLGSLVMILLAAPLGLQLKRSGRQLLWGGLAVGVGFLFFITERLLIAFGESGALPPTVAVWTPLVIFGLAGCAAIIHQQK